jgi:type II secretory pathway pseudopilin PulG
MAALPRRISVEAAVPAAFRRPGAGGTPATTGTTEAFTIIELLVVISIIIALAALVLGTAGYVQQKGARSRAEAEVAAMSAALESYKTDNGVYPSSSNTNTLTATNPTPANYKNASLDLYKFLTGDLLAVGVTSTGQKTYMTFQPGTLGRTTMSSPPSASNTVVYLRDPFGNSYGYSTSRNPDANPNAATAPGYNPTFDLWSTAGSTATTNPIDKQWVKNW